MAIIRARLSASAEAQELPVQTANTLDRIPRPSLPLTEDGPGTLSSFGPRHDNDKINYKQIEILPTADEILAVNRPVYMPKKDLRTHNFLPIGPTRHLDLLFRQLRYDSTESIRDICYSAAQIAFLGTTLTGQSQSDDTQEQIRHETVAGNRYFLYRDVRVEELLAHEAKSMLVRVSYDCPPFMRGRKMYNSHRFQEGMLVALIKLDHITNQFSVVFLEVNLSQTTFSMDSFKGGGRRAAVQLAFLPSSRYDDVLQLCRHALGLCQQCELFLVEFPKVLFAGFYNCLKRLQEMEDTDFAFRQYVAPDMPMDEALLAMERNLAAGGPSMIPCPPPVYADSPTFTYNLGKIVPPTSRIASMSLQDLSHDISLTRLKQETSLDDGQVTALRDCLTREFALTQGPPGCGKTYLGVQLAKTLLESRPRPKPVLLVCLTNHALDSFLADLRDAGVSSLLRIGSGSKVEWTKSINIQNCRRKVRLRKEDSMAMATFIKRRKETFTELDSLCKGLSSQYHTGIVSWQYVQEILSARYPQIYAQLSTNAPSSHAKAFTFEYWSGGGDLENIRNLHVELALRLAEGSMRHGKSPPDEVQDILLDIIYYARLQSSKAGDGSIWDLSLQNRQQLLQRWEAEVDREHMAVKVADLHFELGEYARDIKRINNSRDLKIMATHDIIGMTTTACAARWELLRSIEVETLICEEAAEVMEAHTLCSLLPTLQHAIFIGDPLQLRPEATEPTLSIENRVGTDYRLDESLLERLMFPRDPSAWAMPTSHLNVQRRMHPEIADLARLTYPYLKDHVSTLSRTPSYGFEHRMFWWDHRVPELACDDLKSHVNLHEVEMVASLVEYLLRNGAYSQGEIAVLTPYSGQLAQLHERLSITCDIWLSDKDREALLDEELLALGEEGRATKDEVAISDMLRVSTVDNFQGEEAKIIVLSTVRSGGQAGFLKITNRINVACSRARNGFYIIGNSQTLSQVPMWRRVISTFNDPKTAVIYARRLAISENRAPGRVSKHVQSDVIMAPVGTVVKMSVIPASGRLFLVVTMNDLRRCCVVYQIRSRHVLIPAQKVVLECGHLCPSLHGEICPPASLCPKCMQSPQLGIPMLYLPQCGHLVSLAQLDRINLTAIHGRGADGFKICLADIQEPKCTCGVSCPATRRYMLESKLVSFPNTLDRLVAKMGRKIQRYTRTIEVTKNGLDENLDSFVDDIRPNPLAAKQNTAHLIRRYRDILKLQKEIAKFRDEVVDPTQRCLAELHDIFPSIIGSYKLMFRLHFDVLEYRVINVRIVDTLKLSDYLLQLHDSSYGVQRQGLKMLEFANKESTACVGYCEDALDDPVVKSGPCIESEIRLLQIRFRLLAKSTQSKLSELRAEAQLEPQSADDSRLRASLDAVIDICRRLPTTHDGFLDTVHEFAKALGQEGSSDFRTVPNVKNDTVRKIEKSWGMHEVGFLTTCGESHLYSAKTFPEGCPDCGKSVTAMDDVYRQSSKYLFEKQFLAAMNAGDSKPTKATANNTTTSTNACETSASQEIIVQNAVITERSRAVTSEERVLTAVPTIKPGNVNEFGVANLCVDDCDNATKNISKEAAQKAGHEQSQVDNKEGSIKDLTNEEKFLIAMRGIGKK